MIDEPQIFFDKKLGKEMIEVKNKEFVEDMIENVMAHAQVTGVHEANLNAEAILDADDFKTLVESWTKALEELNK